MTNYMSHTEIIEATQPVAVVEEETRFKVGELVITKTTNPNNKFRKISQVVEILSVEVLAGEAYYQVKNIADGRAAEVTEFVMCRIS